MSRSMSNSFPGEPEVRLAYSLSAGPLHCRRVNFRTRYNTCCAGREIYRDNMAAVEQMLPCQDLCAMGGRADLILCARYTAQLDEHTISGTPSSHHRIKQRPCTARTVNESFASTSLGLQNTSWPYYHGVFTMVSRQSTFETSPRRSAINKPRYLTKPASASSLRRPVRARRHAA